MAQQRIEKELIGVKDVLYKQQIWLLSVKAPYMRSIFDWRVIISKPPNSKFNEQQFELAILFLNDFPTSPPIVKFLTAIIHPIADKYGYIKIEILRQEHWFSHYNILKVLWEIWNLLSVPIIYKIKLND